MTTHAQGSVPSTLDAVLLLCGAVLAFGLVGAGAFGSINQLIAPPDNLDVQVWAGIHLPSVGTSVQLCSIIVHVLPGQWMCPLIGFTATATYLLVLAAQFWMTTWKRKPRPRA